MTSERYDEGFMAGLAGAHAELRVWELGDHEPTCDCDPCETVRVIVEHVLLAPQTPVLLPDHHIDGCSRPCGESCACWCHAAGSGRVPRSH